MNNLTYKSIRRFDEDIIGLFARQSYRTFKPSKTSNYLKNSFLKKGKNPYKVLLYKHRQKFFKKIYKPRKKEFLWFRRHRRKIKKKWSRRPWSQLQGEMLRARKEKKKKGYITGLNFTYNLTTVYKTKFHKKSKKNQIMKKNLFLMKKKLKKFYQFKTLKKFMLILYPNKSINKHLGYSYAYLLEARLEVILYRSNFFISILEARQSIIHKHILVNGKIVTKSHYVVKIGEIISVLHENVCKKKYKKLKQLLLQKQILINYPAYLEVNYKLFSIILIKNPKTKEVPFPFLLNLDFMQYRSIK